MTVTLKLPTSTPHFSTSVELDGSTYGLEFMWNARAESWFVTLTDSSDNVLVAGRRLVIGLPLFSRTRDVRAPGGFLIASDTSNTGVEAGLDDLGVRVQVLYLTAAEVASGVIS